MDSEIRKKIIAEKRDFLVNRKMDMDWDLLREDVEAEVSKLRKNLKYFDLDLDCIQHDDE